jgi:hypothetical protein
MSKVAPNAIPRRKRFKVCVSETRDVTFTVMAFTQEEAESQAEVMAVEGAFPKDAEENCERQINAWRATK